MTDRKVYLDNNATTPLHPEVRKAMTGAMDIFGNPSSLHERGRQARKMVEDARETVASFIGADTNDVIFVGSGSEANNTVLSILSCPLDRCTLQKGEKSGIIISKIEHPCILETAKCMKEKGINVTFLDVDRYGKVDFEQLKANLSPKVSLVSIMMANNEIGIIQDIKAISEIVHQNGSLFHTDAVQAVGKIPVNVKDLNVDFLTLSAHKIYGPKGVGALYIKKGLPFCPLIRGGHQEKGRRAGTENTLGIIGFAKAVEMRAKEMDEEEKRLLKMKTALREGLKEKVPSIWFNGHLTDCLPGTLNVSFEGAEGEAILLYMDLEGICISTGSACASGSLDPSHVLLATGVPVELAHDSIRFSLGRESTMEDIEYVLEKLPGVIEKIRGMSTLYSKGHNPTESVQGRPHSKRVGHNR